jgi:hypothetical protein
MVFILEPQGRWYSYRGTSWNFFDGHVSEVASEKRALPLLYECHARHARTHPHAPARVCHGEFWLPVHYRSSQIVEHRVPNQAERKDDWIGGRGYVAKIE